MAAGLRRGEIWWANLPAPIGSGPGFRRPVLVVQSNVFNASQIGTVIVAAITSNIELARAPGNVHVEKKESRLPKESVVNVSQLATLDQRILTERVSSLLEDTMARIDAGIRLVLSV